jgi:hypothetical protein
MNSVAEALYGKLADKSETKKAFKMLERQVNYIFYRKA